MSKPSHIARPGENFADALQRENSVWIKESASKSGSTVDHPPHYNAHPSGIECIVVAEHYGFNLGNVIKYLWRAEEKGAPLEDLKKARWYLDREIQRRDKQA